MNLTMPARSTADDSNVKIEPEYRNRAPGMKYRMFGKTGLMLSALGIGGVGAVGWMYPHMIDAGLNYVQYYGDHELPKLLKDKKIRDRLFIIGGAMGSLSKLEKHKYKSWRTIDSLVNKLLKKLNIEQLDILNVNIGGFDFLPDYLIDTKERLIKAGKIRFLTSSHHNLMPPGDAKITLRKFSAIYDGFLGGFNFLSGKKLPRQAFSTHRIGIITFKPMRGLQWSSELKDQARKEGIVPQEAAVRWLLAIPEITSVVRLIPNYVQLESNLKAVRADLSKTEELYLHRAALAMANSTCDLCGTCSKACPHGIFVANIQRCRLYAQGFNDVDRARDLYNSLGEEHSALACRDCGSCEEVCPKHLPIRESMALTHEILSA